MLVCVSTIISTVFLEGDKIIPSQEKYNMATFMVLFLLITIEVVVVKVITSDMERDEDSFSGLTGEVTFFDDNFDPNDTSYRVWLFLPPVLLYAFLFFLGLKTKKKTATLQFSQKLSREPCKNAFYWRIALSSWRGIIKKILYH